jgi:hypothetical protein
MRNENSDFCIPRYLPPPAQAQAQPAQAHAQAQPPPDLPPPRELDTLGGGLVVPVTFSVKVLRLPIVFCEKVCTPVTICAAKSAPGRAERPED